MADTIPMVRREQRRHLLMNGWLIAGFIVVGTAVTNERGIFRPVGMDGLSATARAFIAVASPAGLPGLAPRLRDVRSVSSLDPFEVTAPSRDVRRRLIDAIDWVPGEGDQPAQEPLSFGPGAPITVADASDSGNPSSPGQQAAFATPPESLGVTTPTVPAQVTPADPVTPNDPITGAVPEPATWAMLILGFGVVGSILRAVERRRRQNLTPVMRRRRGQRPGGLAA
ncbi:PEPxxWA-CTERM sorting domain-containing protein [Sphingomonas sp. AP4-R1]|uniref:PEPxxWA-CTERM sorting domain-containing protein n=1 Tax=Sphingomonas sp. AP4-R1 TaxID=2735134 RepID=UPI0014938C07|nr:PEPxxWA-CTERM sorting domain-containing protein [Sphingomonas sp. AP4-R1]QJU59666.1 PEPxxWA-CTERM sorting domain-containing protein [Sphingomonas sp. AP4-R1]